MTDIFISYAHSDRKVAANLAAALEEVGFNVWWDRKIEAGDEFSERIERQLNEAAVVIVVWSEGGNKSPWVRDEATLALKQDKLAPVQIDATGPPLGFQQYQSIDLSNWRGRASDESFQSLCKAIARQIETNSGVVTTMNLPDIETGFATQIEPRHWYGIAGFVVAAAILISGFWVWSDRSAQGPDSSVREQTVATGVGVAVLPFKSATDDEDAALFADGLSGELLNWLGNVEGLRVPGRSFTLYYKEQQDDLAGVSESLGVRYLLEGSVLRSGDMLRVRAQLVEGETGNQIWSETFDSGLDDLFSIEDEIARNVVIGLLGAIPERDIHNPVTVGDVDPKAHVLYLEGRSVWLGRNYREAAEKFNAATLADPNHSLAHAYLAVVMAYAIENGRTIELGDEGKVDVMNRSIAKAVQIMPEASEVLFAQGFVNEVREKKNANVRPENSGKSLSQEYYQRAVRSNPRNVEALYALARDAKDDEKSIEALKTILEIDRGLQSARSALANMYIKIGSLDKALQITDETFALFPDTPAFYGGFTAKKAGNIEKAGDYLFKRGFDGLQSSISRRTAISILADLGLPDKSADLLRREEQWAGDEQFRLWLRYMQHVILQDSAARLDIADQIYELDRPPSWAPILLADALLSNKEPQQALDVLIRWRPDLAGSDNPEIFINAFSSVGDTGAHYTAMALEELGRYDEAEKIWSALLQAENEIEEIGWRKPIHLAILYAHLDQTAEAIEQLKTAYGKGFRFIYSFDCNTCITTDFFRKPGVFSPLYDNAEYQDILTTIQSENARTLARLNRRYGVLDSVESVISVD